MGRIKTAQIEGWLDLLRCPLDQSALSVGDDTQKVADGRVLLECRRCGLKLPLRDGIVDCPDGSATSDDARAIINQEEAARDAAAEAYDEKRSAYRQAVEIDPCLDAISPQEDDVVADLGCGTGYITRQYASRVQRVVAVDHSMRSLTVFRKAIPSSLMNRILLVRADLRHLPLSVGTFTKAVSFQVLEHIPTAPLRQEVVRGRPGGLLVCTVYNWSVRKQREAAQGVGDNTLKEGFHETGVYYYNFQAAELSDLVLGEGLMVNDVRGIVVSVRGTRLLGKLAAQASRILSHTPVGLRNAELLLATARRITQDD